MSVRWFSVDPRTSEEVNYTDADAKKLEESYKGTKASVTLTLGGTKFTIDIKNMTQSNNTGGSRSVRRVQTAGTATAGDGKVSVPKEIHDFWQATCNGADIITAEDFAPLFTALKVDATNVDCFLFVYWMQCVGPWKITRDEFEQAFAKDKVSPKAADVAKVISGVKSNLAKSSADWLKFNTFVFKFVRASNNATVVPTDEAVAFMRLCFTVGPKLSFPTEEILAYVESKCKAVFSDVWANVAKFCLEIKADLSNYSEAQVWNTVIDDFVEARKQ